MKTNKIKILITGGFGAIGHNLTNLLSQEPNNEINIVDNLSAGITNFKEGINFSHLDISNPEKVNKYFRNFQPDYIYHLAAHFANQNSVDHPISDVTTNIIGTINLLEAQKNNPSIKKVIYASSSCVYGNNSNMSEDVSIKPYDTPYAINKYVGELYCKYYSEIQNIPTVCVRIFNSYGPGEMPGAYRNVIPNFILKALSDEDITITGSGDETRDFTYITDTIGLLHNLAHSHFKNAEVFNAGTGKKVSIRKLAEIIIDVTKSNSKIIFSPARNWDHVKDRCSDISKSQEILNYNPQSDLREGIVNTVNWIKTRI
jgi:UDP-glucose 4-epimerase